MYPVLGCLYKSYVRECDSHESNAHCCTRDRLLVTIDVSTGFGVVWPSSCTLLAY